MMGRRQQAEQISGRFAALPHAVMDSTAFMGASDSARSLLLELVRQHTGKNNGHFQLTSGWLRRRGWKSSDMVQRAKAEVIARQLAIKTRLGGLNAGPDLWAVTWLPISDYAGLTEVSATTYHPGAWHFLNPPLTIPRNPAYYPPDLKKRDERTAGRNSAVPPVGTAEGFTVPPVGTKTAPFSPVTVPPAGNNEVTSSPRQSSVRRVVGKKGASGKPKKAAKVYRLVQPVASTYAPKRKSA